MGAGASGLETCSFAFPRHKQGVGWEVEKPELQLAPVGDADATGKRLDCADPKEVSRAVQKIKSTLWTPFQIQGPCF